MCRIKFFVPGKPFGKQRPRFGAGHMYTPRATGDYEELVAECCLAEMKRRDMVMYPEKLPLKVSIKAYFEIPESWSKKKKIEAVCGQIAPVTKPDADNVAKTILDGMQGALFADDRFVTELSVKKIYSNEPHVEVEVQPA